MGYLGDLTISSSATIDFDLDKTMTVSGGFDALGGGVFDLTGLTLDLSDDEYFFLTIGDFQGIGGGDDLTDNVSLETIALTGLVNPYNAMRITESDFKLGAYPASKSVYALIQESGQIGLQWSIPEPSRPLLAALAFAFILLRRRSWSR